MTVKELIEKLEEFPKDEEVYLYDAEFLSAEPIARVSRLFYHTFNSKDDRIYITPSFT